MGVVHVVAEYTPYAHTGGLADAVAGLARFQAAAGIPTAVLMPLHRSVHRAAEELLPVGRPFPVEVGPRVEWARLYRVAASPRAPRVYFIEHDGYFNRPGPYGAGGQDYSDNGLRFAFFAQAALAALPRITNAPVVVHAHDWHAALVPVYLETPTPHQAHEWYNLLVARSLVAGTLLLPLGEAAPESASRIGRAL